MQVVLVRDLGELLEADTVVLVGVPMPACANTPGMPAVPMYPSVPVTAP